MKKCELSIPGETRIALGVYAWPAVPGGAKKLLWEGQVRDMAAASRAEAIRRGKMMQATFNFF